jgi:hypothetical protein
MEAASPASKIKKVTLNERGIEVVKKMQKRRPA